MSSASTTSNGTMPGRSASSAPKFDGSTQFLKRFLDEVRDLADEKSVTDAQAIKSALSYIPAADYEHWSALPSAAGSDWAAFTKELFAFYPGAEKSDRQYTKTDLYALIKRTRTSAMSDQAEFGRYYRSFFTITTFLKTKGRIGEAECSERLVEGLPEGLRDELVRYLRAKEPSHHVDDPWPLTTLYEAILFVISNLMSSGTAVSHLSRDDKTPAVVKTEVFDASRMEQFFESDAFLGKVSAFMNRTAPRGPPRNNYDPRFNPNQHYGTPNSSNAFPNQGFNGNQPSGFNAGGFSGPMICAFCSEPNHFHKECPMAQRYIDEGRCGRNNEGKMVLPGGMFISARTLPGKNIKERVDSWHHVNSPQATSTPATTGFFLQVSQNPENATNIMEPPAVYLTTEAENERAEDEVWHLEQTMMAAQARILALKQEVSVFGPTTRARSYGNDKGPEKRDAPPHLVGNSATTQAKPKMAMTPTLPSVPENISRMMPRPPQMGPQFSYQSAIESRSAIEEVVAQSLNSEVTLTNRQLLAVAPEVRKALRDQTTPKRVPTNDEAPGTGGKLPENAPKKGVASFLATACCDKDDAVVVAEHLVDLRAITVEIPQAGKVEAILDEGCQIVAISKKVWEKSGLPLRSDRILNMESANAQKNETMGLLPDLPLTIGGHTFYVQCQVVDNAPYQMLMGRPFMTLTQSSVRHFSNGDSHLTLVDPNTTAVITIPTHARNKAAEDAAGF